MADSKYEEIRVALMAIAQKYNIIFHAILGIEGGRGWLNYEQIEENDYRVHVSMSGGFNVYKGLRADLNALFETHASVLTSETDYRRRVAGTQKELIYIDKDKYNEIEERRKAAEAMAGGHVLNIGTINAQGGNVVFGDVVNSTLLIDNSVTKIKEMIDERGGEDKAELHAILDEVKEIADRMVATGKIEAKPSLKERFSNHMVKHGWLYGEIVGLLGTVAIQLTMGA